MASHFKSCRNVPSALHQLISMACSMLRQWVFYCAPQSICHNVRTAFSSPLQAIYGSDIFSVFWWSSFFSQPPRHLFRVGLAGGQQSGAKQQRPGSPYSGCAETENARFGSILYLIGKQSGRILNILMTFVLHSKYILNAFQVFQLDSVCIFGCSNCIRQPFREHSGCIRTAVETPSCRRYSGSNRTAVVRHSTCILNILTAF